MVCYYCSEWRLLVQEMSWSGRGLEKPKSPATTTTDYVKTVPASVATTDFVKTIPAKAHVSSGMHVILLSNPLWSSSGQHRFLDLHRF